jgi:hypothetical protein
MKPRPLTRTSAGKTIIPAGVATGRSTKAGAATTFADAEFNRCYACTIGLSNTLW